MKRNPEDKPIKSKLLVVMAGLEKTILLRFQKQIIQEGSPKRDMVRIFNYCLKYHPDYNHYRFYRKYAYRKIFNESFNYSRLMKGISIIFIRLEKFLSEQELEQTSFLNDYLLAKAYYRYNLSSPFEQLVSKKTGKQLNNENIESYLEQMQWNHLAYFSGISSKIKGESIAIKKSSHALEAYFVGVKLRHLCELATRKAILGEPYSDEFENIVFEYCMKNESNLPKVFRLYRYAFQLITSKEELIFQLYKKQYLETWCTLGKEDQVVLLTYLMNYVIGETRQNKEVYLILLFQLYQFGIDKKILLINERFVADHFVNLMYVASYLNEFEWINRLLNEWEELIISWLPPSAFNLSMARLTFAQGLFNECQTYLLDIDYSSYVFSFRAKTIEIACSYELKESIVRIESQCKAYENYLRRHASTHEENCIGGLNFIYIIRQLIKVNPKKEKLLQSFNDFKFIIFPKWLQEKIIELK